MSPSIGSVCLGCASLLSFDSNQLLFRKLLLSLLRDVQAQHTMLQLCGNVFFRERLAHIEAPLQRSVITLLTYGLTLLRLILLDLFRGRDGQITILKAQLNLILLEAGQYSAST